MNQLSIAILLGSFLLYVFLLSRNTFLGWLSILAVQLYEFSFGISQVVVGSIHLDAVDVVSMGLLFAGVIRTLPRMRERNTARIIGLGYLAIFAASLIRGFFENGIPPAANESRGFVPILAALLYFLTASTDSESLRKYVVSYLCYGGGFVVVALLAYAGFRVGGVAWLHSAEQITDTIENRLLPASAAFGLAICFILSLSFTIRREPGKLAYWLPAVYLGTAIFLRHRTVWVVLLGATASFVFTDRRLLRRLIPLAAFSLLIVAIFASIASLTSSEGGGARDTAEDTSEEFAYSASEAGTWRWRVDVWASYLFGQDQSVGTVMFGRGLGAGYYSLNPEAGTWISAPPHSEYVAEYSRVGLIGVCFVVWLLIRTGLRFWAFARENTSEFEPSASTWVAVVVSAMVYGITYSVPLDVFALVGIACAVLAKRDAEIPVQVEELTPSESTA
jgi:hypothetical protein